jgi:dihydrofolate synthase/folylpolyglutamate synthase
MNTQEAVSYLLQMRSSDFFPAEDRMRRLMAHLGDVQKRLRFVHVAGTNGKGSTSCLVASVLQAAGYRTGLYTSPHLVRFSERICIDGVPIGDDALTRLAGVVRAAEEELSLPLAAFDRMTATALLYFAESGCDLVVLEVGLGGLLDATNVIDEAEVSVITNIGLDHTEILGRTVEEIAAQKAGIIKENGRVVLYPQTSGVEAVVEHTCRMRRAALTKADFSEIRTLPAQDGLTCFTYRGSTPLLLGLRGSYQLRNAAVALEAVDVLRSRGFSISQDAVRDGFLHARWPGRFELLRPSPVFLLDGGHNPQCAEALAESLRASYPGETFVFLLGMMADKDVSHALSVITPLMKAAVTVTVQNPRAMKGDALAARLRDAGVPAESAPSLSDAVRRADALADGGPVCAFGSLYLAGAVKALFAENEI